MRLRTKSEGALRLGHAVTALAPTLVLVSFLVEVTQRGRFPTLDEMPFVVIGYVLLASISWVALYFIVWVYFWISEGFRQDRNRDDS